MGKVLCEAPKSNLMPPKKGHSKSLYSSRPTVDPVLKGFARILSVEDILLWATELGCLSSHERSGAAAELWGPCGRQPGRVWIFEHTIIPIPRV